VLGVWSPDGKRVALTGHFEAAPDSLSILESDGSRKQLSSPNPKNDYVAVDWSPDGKALLYWESDNETASGRFGIYPLIGNSKPQLLFEKQSSNLPDARFSPDGKWIAFISDRSGRSEIYVAPFGRPGAPVQISTHGGQNVRWTPDGKNLLYMAADYQIIRIPLGLGATVQAGEQSVLFQLPPIPGMNSPLGFEVAPDGKRLLVNAPVGEASKPLTVVVNWQSELGKH